MYLNALSHTRHVVFMRGVCRIIDNRSTKRRDICIPGDLVRREVAAAAAISLS